MAGALVVIFAAGCAGEARDANSPTVTTTGSVAASNKALVSGCMDDIWAKRNLDAISRCFSADLVNHAAIPEAQGARGMRSIATKLLAAFPDLSMHVDDVAVSDQDVVVRVTFEGTQTGTLEFKNPVLATNKHVKIDQVHTFRVENGKIVEAWMVMDHLEMLKQLGVGPGAPKPGAP
jgi:predicted ester cyclase